MQENKRSLRKTHDICVLGNFLDTPFRKFNPSGQVSNNKKRFRNGCSVKPSYKKRLLKNQHRR